MRIWIDADLCVGAGTCEQLAPDLFEPTGDGVWIAKGAGADGQASVPKDRVEAAIAAAEECPGECIYVAV